MKRSIIFLTTLTAITGLVICGTIQKTKESPPATMPAAAEYASDPSVKVAFKTKSPQTVSRKSRSATAVFDQSSRDPQPQDPKEVAFKEAIDALVSPHSTYEERQLALKQLKESGRLADAAKELEQRKANDPNEALYPSALGQIYLKLCGTTTDVRQQAIWAMTADTDFETALNLDPSNWDARFTRAVAMTFWPEGLNKGDEVIQQLNTLIDQQEQQTPQPQFAQTYLWLGKQYQKSGQADAAQQVWQQGAALYPDNPSFQSLLTSSGLEQQ